MHTERASLNLTLPPTLILQQRSCAGGRTGRALQFFSWTSHRAMGSVMVEPRWLAWDPDVTLCALAYEDGVTLAAVRPQFRAIAALPIAHATSGALPQICSAAVRVHPWRASITPATAR